MRVLYRLAGRLPARAKLAIVHMREAHFLVGMLAVVVDEEGRILLFRHTYRPFAPWGLPSGWLRSDEDIHDSMSREIREETGLEVDFCEVMRVDVGSRPRRIDVWLRYRAREGMPRASAEVDEVRYFALDALPPLIASQERFLRENRDRIRS